MHVGVDLCLGGGPACNTCTMQVTVLEDLKIVNVCLLNSYMIKCTCP